MAGEGAAALRIIPGGRRERRVEAGLDFGVELGHPAAALPIAPDAVLLRVGAVVDGALALDDARSLTDHDGSRRHVLGDDHVCADPALLANLHVADDLRAGAD